MGWLTAVREATVRAWMTCTCGARSGTLAGPFISQHQCEHASVIIDASTKPPSPIRATDQSIPSNYFTSGRPVPIIEDRTICTKTAVRGLSVWYFKFPRSRSERHEPFKFELRRVGLIMVEKLKSQHQTSNRTHRPTARTSAAGIPYFFIQLDHTHWSFPKLP